MVMTTMDLTPLWRSTVGFDRALDLLDATLPRGAGDNYPPYDIERLAPDRYRITLAIAGAAPADIDITVEQNVLTVQSRGFREDRRYLYQGIPAHPFRRVFNLADYVQVEQAAFENGLLTIELVREVPEAMKPRQIPIAKPASNKPEQDAKQAA